MTVDETREIFGDDAKNLTDEQLQNFILTTSGVVDIFLEFAVEDLTQDIKYNTNKGGR